MSEETRTYPDGCVYTGEVNEDGKKAIEEGLKLEEKVLGLMEKAMELRGHKFVGGDSITIADH